MPERVFNLTREMLDHSFAETVAPDREKLLTCIQCGTCTASCPTAYAMDYTPRQLWRLVQVGLRDEALRSRTFWLCTNCYSCTIRCPRGIALTETMAALKRLAIAEGVNGKDKDNVSAFYRAFVATVRRHGRNHEVELLIRYFLSTNPLSALSFARLGAGLFLKHRVPLLPKEPKAKQDVEKLFQASLAVEKAAMANVSAHKTSASGQKEAQA